MMDDAAKTLRQGMDCHPTLAGDASGWQLCDGSVTVDYEPGAGSSSQPAIINNSISGSLPGDTTRWPVHIVWQCLPSLAQLTALLSRSRTLSHDVGQQEHPQWG